MRYEDFFAYARARHRVYLLRESGAPRPWTTDPVLLQYRFTNVFREFDATTVWFRKNVRDELSDRPEVLLATVLFRWFNRIGTGEVLFLQSQMIPSVIRPGPAAPWLHYLNTGSTDLARLALRAAIPDGPWVTGSYMIRSPSGMGKLAGMLHLAEQFYRDSGWRARAEWMLARPGEATMEACTRWLQTLPGMGPFLAYEVACDLQWTALLRHAPDIMTWANVGPGALRGLGRLHRRSNASPRKAKHKWAYRVSEAQAMRELRDLLRMSTDAHYWPQEWKSWDMRTVEHTLCEFDKYQRVLSGEGAPKQLFR